MGQINELAKRAHENAKNKGWWDEPRSFGEQIALMHSELSEALEDHRNPEVELTDVWYVGNGKPCGVPTELADVVIRIMDTCVHYGIDLEQIILEKMAYNETRSHKHGGKRI